METLEIEEHEGLGGWTITTLITLPIIAFLLAVYVFLYFGKEPFGALCSHDVVVILGGPVLVGAMWLAWAWMVCAKKLAADVWAPVLIWAAFTLLLAFGNVPSYFHQPWTLSKPQIHWHLTFR